VPLAVGGILAPGGYLVVGSSFGTLYFRDPSAGHELQRFYRAMAR